METINEAAFGKNQQFLSIKVLIFGLHYITMYFSDIKFPSKDSMATQAFAFSKFKKQTPT